MQLKRIRILLLTLLFASAGICSAQAGDKAVSGLIIGAGSGAIIGQAAGQNTESVLIGTAIGGAVGYAIGNSMDQSHRTVYRYDRYRPVPPHYSQQRSWNRYQPRHYSHDKGFKYRQDYQRGHSPCQKTVTLKKKNGRMSKTVKTVCDRPGFNHHPRDNSRANWYR